MKKWKRPANWLTPEDAHSAENMEKYVRQKLGKPGGDPETLSYTPHDVAHFGRVEQRIIQLIPEDRWTGLRPQERKLLTWAAWTHDIGMNKSLYLGAGEMEASEVRARHVEKSAEWVVDNDRELELTPIEAQVLAHFIRFHSRKYDLETCPIERHCGDQIVRPRLMAAYLRLADALDVDHARVERHEGNRFAYLSELGGGQGYEETIFHWVKSFVVAGIIPKHAQQTIEVEFHWPAEKGNGRATKYDLLVRYVLDEIRAELETVEDTLADNELSSFRQVVRAADQEFMSSGADVWVKSVDRVLEHLRIRYSPNSTEMVLATLQSLEEVAGKANLRHELQRFQDRMREEVVSRSCHNALQHILDFARHARAHLDHGTDKSRDEAVKEKIRGFVDHMRGLVDPNREAVRQQSNNFWEAIKGHKGKRRSFLLFGCSESVVAALCRKPPEIERVDLWIAECRPKTRHGPQNSVSYLDAQRYVQMIRSAKVDNDPLWKYVRIWIIPDASIATFLERKEWPRRNPTDDPPMPIEAVLIGANGVYLDKDFCAAHTAGHLGVALAAEKFKKPVVLIAGSLKILEKSNSNWKLNQRDKGDGAWLSSDGEFLEGLRGGEAEPDGKVKLLNLREDQVSLSLLSCIVTEKGIILHPSAGGLEKLTEWRNAMVQRLASFSDFGPAHVAQAPPRTYRSGPSASARPSL